MTTGALTALVLSTLAGLSTSLGGGIAVLSRRGSGRTMAFSLGFSAGVMSLISFVELLPEARRGLTPALGSRWAGPAAALCLIAGALAALLIDRLVPDPERTRTVRRLGEPGGGLRRVGMVTAVAVLVHNLPEGITTFMAGYADLRLGVPVAISIALHNIPEGIAVAAPIYFGTGSRRKALGLATLSGLSEPAGALLAYLILAPYLSPAMLGGIFGVVAGIMIAISFDGLIPAAGQGGRPLWGAGGVVAGMAFMQTALALFGG